MTSIKDEIEEYFESKMSSLDIEDSDVPTTRYFKAARHSRLNEMKVTMLKLVDEVERQMVKWNQL